MARKYGAFGPSIRTFERFRSQPGGTTVTDVIEAGGSAGGRAAGHDVQVVEADPCSEGRWEPFVAAHPNGTAYHHPAWTRVLEQEYSAARSVHLICESGGELRGVLSLLETRGMPFGRGVRTGRRLSSLPRTPVGGPLALDRVAAEALARAAIERVDGLDGISLELKLPSNVSDLAVAGASATPWREGYYLDLPTDPDELRFGNSRNNARIGWAVRHAEKLGVAVRQAETLDDVRSWYPLYLTTMRTHLVPARPFRLFASMWNELAPKGLMRLLLAEHRSAAGVRLIAGSVFLMFGSTVAYAFNGRAGREGTMRANELMLTTAMRSACTDGYRRFDFGEVSAGNEGLADFKSKWGSQTETLSRLYHPRAPEAEAGDVAGGAGKVHRAARRVWSHAPLGLTARVGERLYAYM